MRKIVLLPEPLGPSRPTISPCSMAKDTSVTARRGPYHLVTCCASTSGDISLPDPAVANDPALRTARTQSRARGPGLGTAHCAVRSLVIFWRMLMGFVNVRIVRIDDVAALGVVDPPDPGIGVEHTDRIVDAADARQDVLLEILLQIDGIAGQHDRSRLGQTYDHDLAARRMRHGAMDVDAVVAEQVEVAVELDSLVLARHRAADAVAQHGK